MISKMTTDEIEQIWTALMGSPDAPAHRRVSADHPMDLYLECDEQRRVGLVALGSVAPAALLPYAAVEIATRRRADDRFATTVKLASPALRSLFAAMCAQVINEGTATSADPIIHLLTSVERWRRLFELGPSGLLSDQAQRGLLGELLELDLLVSQVGGDRAVSAWVGPQRAPQDFRLDDRKLEVKCIGAGTASVRISSLDQLDVADSMLDLVVYEVSRTAPDASSITLSAMANQVRNTLNASPSALAGFERQLLTAGFVDHAEYDRVHYRVTRRRVFLVSDAFPRMVRSQIGKFFQDARYEIYLEALREFERKAP